MFCTDKQRTTCNEEKMGCVGCHYFNDKNKILTSMQQLEIHIANHLNDEQWNNWQEVLKYIKELQENQCNHNISNECITKQTVKDKILTPMKEEHDKAIDRFFKEDISHVPENGDVAQELGYFIGKIEKILED